MHKILLTIALLFFLTNNAFTQPIERDQVEEKYKWNLADIYPSVDAWQADIDMLKTEVEKLADFKGTLGESSESLYKALSFGNDLVKTLWQAWIYACYS